MAFYRLSDGRELGTLPIHADSAALSRSGGILAVVNAGRVMIWDISP